MSLSPQPRSQAKGPPSPAEVRFECECKLDARGSATLELSGELDRAVCGLFEARLAEAQRASAVVILDLHRLGFMDSAGYAVLVRAARASSPEAKILLAGCSGQVGRLLNLVGLPEKVEMQGPYPVPSAFGGGGQGSGASIGA